MRFRMRTVAAFAAGSVVALGAIPLGAQTKVEPYDCPPCVGLTNAFIRADISPYGNWALGTTGGDPTTPSDNNKDLLYDFRPGGVSHLGSSYPTIRIISAQGTRDFVPSRADTVAQLTVSDSVRTAWLVREPSRLRVTETLSLVTNPFSGQPDVVDIAFETANEGIVALSVGVRALLDVQVADNDGAPYFVAGEGAVSTERDYRAAAVPPYWLAFESDAGDPRQLRGVGILDSAGIVRPDRLVIAYWKDIRSQAWDYAINPTKPVTIDSAVALFWEPVPLAPGASRRVNTRYGLAGQGGGEAFIVAENPRCGSTVPVSLFVRNLSTDDLTGGRATLATGAGVALAAGESATKAIAALAPGGTASVIWRIDVGPATRGPVDLSARATFDAGRDYTASATIQVACAFPTPTTPPTATARPSPATPSPGPSVTATPDEDGRACDFIRTRVPPAVVSHALANRERIQGWNQLANPNAPPGPANPPRRWLSLQNINRPFHPFYNTVVYKAGCP
jgi:hypothetical protein